MIIGCIIYPAHLNAEERDPFISIIELQSQKLSAKKIDVSKVVLKGIIWNDSKAIAIIDDELLMAGDEWKGLKVERIDKDSVTLSDEIKSYKLFVEETSELPLPEGYVPPEGTGPYPEAAPFGGPEGQSYRDNEFPMPYPKENR